MHYALWTLQREKNIKLSFFIYSTLSTYFLHILYLYHSLQFLYITNIFLQHCKFNANLFYVIFANYGAFL